MTVTIVPTGVANVASVRTAFARLGATTRLAATASDLRGADYAVLPGVGSFEAGMAALGSAGLVPAIRERIAAGRPTLAICLGMQLLLEGSDEAPAIAGLGIVPGRATLLPKGRPRPQLGWNRVVASGGILPQGAAYFAHSYALCEAPEGWRSAASSYGTRFVAAIESGRVLACQFHPELSSRYGRAVLRAWLEATPRPAPTRTSRTALRVIPCLDVRDGRVVKGIRFEGLRDAGDPAARATDYEAQGADELCVLDVSATPDERATACATVRAVRAELSIPLTVGGGVRSADDAERLLEAGADKVAVNTAAVVRPELLAEIAGRFGRQCTVLSIDALRNGSTWRVRVKSGTEDAGRDAVGWAHEATERGAGEILLTSQDRDGTRSGYDLDLIDAITQAVEVPVIASGGAAAPADMRAAADRGATGLLAASIFHDGDLTVADIKRYLEESES